MPGRSLDEKLDFMEANGVVGYEPHGSKLWERVDGIKKALSGRNIKVSAICAGFEGAPVSEWPEQRKRAMESMKLILEAGG
ncbi:MAG: sugar phosphate isomerase/epimerase, partial [Candidatus Hinthialibacter sp.]